MFKSKTGSGEPHNPHNDVKSNGVTTDPKRGDKRHRRHKKRRHRHPLPPIQDNGYKTIRDTDRVHIEQLHRENDILLNEINRLKAALPPVPPGQYIIFTGADDSLFLMSALKAFREFIIDEVKGYLNSDAQFKIKIEAARKLFPEDKNQLRQVSSSGNLCVSFSHNKIW